MIDISNINNVKWENTKISVLGAGKPRIRPDTTEDRSTVFRRGRDRSGQRWVCRVEQWRRRWATCAGRPL